MSALAALLAAGWGDRHRRARLRWQTVVAGVACCLPLFAVSPGCRQETEERSPPPHVLLVMLDTVRAESMGSYGGPFANDAHFAGLAGQGVLFTRAYAPDAWTYPSHASLFSGLPTWLNGAHYAADCGGTAACTHQVRDDIPTLPEQFGQAGYQTHAISANTWLNRSMGLTRGFDTVEVRSMGCGAVVQQLEAALADADLSQPQFTFLNFVEAHEPYQARPSPFLEERRQTLGAGVPEWAEPWMQTTPAGWTLHTLAPGASPDKSLVEEALRGTRPVPPELQLLLHETYASEIQAADVCLDKAVGDWSSAFGANVVVAVTADHGEYLGERGLLDHGYGVYSQVTHVPLALVAPGRLDPTTVTVPVQLQDVGRTLLGLSGIEAAGPTLMPAIGKSGPVPPVLARSWVTEQNSSWEPFLARSWFLVVSDPWALVTSNQQDRMLFDIQDDPAMQHDVAGAHPDVVADLERVAAASFAVSPVTTPLVEVPESETDLLRALGYLE